jgi:hypothetical protein
MSTKVATMPQSQKSDEQAIEVQIRQESLTVIEQANAITIIDQPTYDRATHMLLSVIKPLRSKWTEFWYGSANNGPIPLAHRAYKSLLDKYNEADKPLELAEASIKNKIRVWDDEQTGIQQELQRKADEEARERERQEREQMVASDPFASEEDAKAIIEAPSTAIARPVEPTYTRAAGVSKRENWKARTTDIKALALAVAKGKVPPNYILPNEPVLNARAKADRQTMNVPGVIPFNDSVISGRSR